MPSGDFLLIFHIYLHYVLLLFRCSVFIFFFFLVSNKVITNVSLYLSQLIFFAFCPLQNISYQLILRGSALHHNIKLNVPNLRGYRFSNAKISMFTANTGFNGQLFHYKHNKFYCKETPPKSCIFVKLMKWILLAVAIDWAVGFSRNKRIHLLSSKIKLTPRQQNIFKSESLLLQIRFLFRKENVYKKQTEDTRLCITVEHPLPVFVFLKIPNLNSI